MNGIILVDKPSGWTSNDVVCKLKGVLHERKVGHSGTLDPMATGLLPVFVGRATKAVEYAENDKKRYIAGLRLGIVTDTLDITGKVLSTFPVSTGLPELQQVISGFLGRIKQVPPMYSAVKINGTRMYKLARDGKSVERPAREVEIFRIDCLGSDASGDYIIDVVCSKGTYIRSLCNDIGTALHCGGCMSSLRRLSCGGFRLDDAVPLNELIKMQPEEIERNWLIPVDGVFSDFPEYRINEKETVKVKNGIMIPVPLSDGIYRVYSCSGEFLILGSVREGILKQLKSFYEV